MVAPCPPLETVGLADLFLGRPRSRRYPKFNIRRDIPIKFMMGYNVEPVVASETAIMESIEKYYGSVHSLQIKEEMDKLVETDEFNDDVEVLEEGDEIDLAELEKSFEEAPVVKLCNLILTDALRRGASDIHIEPYEREFRVRFRIDGVLYVVMNPPMKLRDAMISVSRSWRSSIFLRSACPRTAASRFG